MKNMVVRNLPDEVHRAIKERAAAHGRSAEAELRAIITEPSSRPSGSSSVRCWPRSAANSS